MPSPTPSAIAAERQSTFVRWVHSSYLRSSSIGHYLARRITPIGWAVTGLCIVTLMAAMGRPLLPQIQIFTIFAAIFSLSLIAVVLRRGKVRATRRLPAYGAVGVPLRYTVNVANAGRSLREAWLVETGPDDRPSFELFTAVREPLEHTRNPFDKLFRFYRWRWLRDLLEQFPDAKSTALQLKRGTETTVDLQWTPVRRGQITLDDLRLALPDPLGLFQRCRRVACPSQQLLILPRILPLPTAILPGKIGLAEGDDGSSGHTGSSTDFLALRDYRAGDPKRSIHWASWARLGRPVVREYEDTRTPTIAVILETRIASGGELDFEAAVTIAASTLQAAADQHIAYDLLTTGAGAQRISPAGSDALPQLLALAATEPLPDEAASALPPHLALGLSACLLVTSYVSERTRALVASLQKHDISLRVIAIGQPDDQGKKNHGVTHIEWVSRDEIENAGAGLAQLCD